MYGVVLHAHPVRGESHNQRNTTGEVATRTLPQESEEAPQELQLELTAPRIDPVLKTDNFSSFKLTSLHRGEEFESK